MRIEIVPTYTHQDAVDAPEGHFPFAGTNVDAFFYRQGDELVLGINKNGQCVYRCLLRNAFADFVPASTPPLDPKLDTFLIRSIGDAQKELDQFVAERTANKATQ